MATKKIATKNNNAGVMDITKELWQAAVNLRGAIEPSDYKRYVLPLIFLRFLSLRYEERRVQLSLMIADPKSEYYTTDPAEKDEILEDADEYRSIGAFIIPEEARWDNIRKNAQTDDIKVRLDNILELLEEAYPDQLKGLLPPIYAGSNLEKENVTGLINLFSKDIFQQAHGSEDLIGRIYEYFIGEFASSEGKRGGEYFTPSSIVRLLVAMLEPDKGVVFDPCCGSGGMFVQSDVFTHHSQQLSFLGQESKDFTYRLCRMNLFIHGIDGNIQLGNSYSNDQHPTLKADYILANPPFNDGSKSEHGWGADKINNEDHRLRLGALRLTLSQKNANTMWILHFLSHLKKGGTAGFVMATGELSSGETARREVRQALVDKDYVDCVVSLPGQLFANTPIPCCIWFLSKNRDGQSGYRQRKGEILFIDARKMGALILGSRKQKQLSEPELNQIAAAYQTFRHKKQPKTMAGFCKVATVSDIQAHDYVLTPGRYVGAEDVEEDDEPFAEKMARLTATLAGQFAESAKLEKAIRKNLQGLEYDN
jgi:type I restriction enzyme M protein